VLSLQEFVNIILPLIIMNQKDNKSASIDLQWLLNAILEVSLGERFHLGGITNSYCLRIF